MFKGFVLRKKHGIIGENAERNERRMLEHTTSFHCVFTLKWQECAAIHWHLSMCYTHAHYDYRKMPTRPSTECANELCKQWLRIPKFKAVCISRFSKSGKICGKHSMRITWKKISHRNGIKQFKSGFDIKFSSYKRLALFGKLSPHSNPLQRNAKCMPCETCLAAKCKLYSIYFVKQTMSNLNGSTWLLNII